MSHLHHPDVHMPTSAWSESQVLQVACCYSNPFRWRTRRKLANDFRRHMLQTANVNLHVIELAYGDRPFDITDPSVYPNDIQVRTHHELFHKENLLNLAVQQFPSDWRYGAVIDMDFNFTRHDLALETIHQLQHYDWVQMYSSYMDLSGDDLGKGHRPLGAPRNSFVYNWFLNGMPAGFGQGGWKMKSSSGGQSDSGGYMHKGVGATGGAWAFRRSAWDVTGGLLDRCILGHGDWFMAFGLIGERAPDMHDSAYSANYRQYIHAWQTRAAELNKNIGYVDCFAVHHFHGPKVRRAYSHRDKILVDRAYDPLYDVHPDWQGVLQLSGNKPRFRDAIRKYFVSRSEDTPNSDPV